MRNKILTPSQINWKTSGKNTSKNTWEWTLSTIATKREEKAQLTAFPQKQASRKLKRKIEAILKKENTTRIA